LEQRYGRAVDWWAFGVLMYEMLLGQSPFRGDDEDEIFDAILEDEPLYPITMPRDAVSILQKVCFCGWPSFYVNYLLCQVVDKRSQSPSWVWKRRCRRDKTSAVLQGRELG
jgi:serine/threonine protein kinase